MKMTDRKFFILKSDQLIEIEDSGFYTYGGSTECGIMDEL